MTGNFCELRPGLICQFSPALSKCVCSLAGVEGGTGGGGPGGGGTGGGGSILKLSSPSQGFKEAMKLDGSFAVLQLLLPLVVPAGIGLIMRQMKP